MKASELKKRDILSELWNFIGLVFSVISILNLFGEFGEIPLSDWLKNVIYAYHAFVIPICNILLYPIEKIIHLKFSVPQKDFLIIGFFLIDRLIADVFLTCVGSIVLTNSKYSKEIYRSDFLTRNRSLRRFLIRAMIFERILKFFLMRRAVYLSFKKLAAFIVPFYIIISTHFPNEISHKFQAGEFIILFFCILYFIPIIVFVIFMLLASGEIIAYLLKGALHFLLKAMRSKPYEKPNNLFINEEVIKVLKLGAKQLKFDLSFTFLFLLIIGLNYRYLSS